MERNEEPARMPSKDQPGMPAKRASKDWPLPPNCRDVTAERLGETIAIIGAWRPKPKKE